MSVGLELFTGADLFSACGAEDSLLFKDYKMGSAFGFRYATGYEKTVEGLIRESLDSAIAEGC